MSGNSSKTSAVAKTGQVARERLLPGSKVSKPAYPKRNIEQQSSAAMLVLEKGKKSVLANSKTLELSRLSSLLTFQEALKCISSSASRVDLLHGLNGAPMFTQVDHKKLDEFILEISLKKKGQQNNIAARTAAAAVHYQKLLDNCKEIVAGSSYCEIKSMMDRLIVSGYLAFETDTENLEPGQPEEYPLSQLESVSHSTQSTLSVVKDEELSNSVAKEVLPEELTDRSPRVYKPAAFVTKRASMYRTPLRPPRRTSRGLTVGSQLDEGDSERTQFSLAIMAQNPKLVHWNKFTPRRTPLHRPAKHGGVLKTTQKYAYKPGKKGWQV